MQFRGILLAGLAFIGFSAAACVIKNSDGQPADRKHDPLYELLDAAAHCPKDVRELRELFSRDGLRLSPSMVANRGAHNPAGGSFSFFERVSGHSASLNIDVKDSEFMLGHFTAANADSELVLAQSEGLLIEIIIMDPKKGVYNFYELIGKGQDRTWFYRGDSFDIFEDNRRLNLQSDPSAPVFGQTLRCSACHASGGPILKELEEPHNDWWRTDLPLPLGSLKPSAEVARIMNSLTDASELASAVKEGIRRLESSPRVRAVKAGQIPLPNGRRYGLREALRPLFTTVEINLLSDRISNGEFSQVPELHLSSAAWMDPRLASLPLSASREAYLEALRQSCVSFPENGRLDADHAWLGPVKSYSDQVAIDYLIRDGILNEDFVLAVLAVDQEHPLFSPLRAQLLRAVPEFLAPHWKQSFLKTLEGWSRGSAAFAAMAANAFLEKYKKAPEILRHEASEALAIVKKNLEDSSNVAPAVQRLVRDRQSVFDAEISKNPKGQILEPGFRVIFPQAGCERDLDRNPTR